MPGQKAPEDARREQILRSAYQIAALKGITGLTIRLVASNAGLSSGLVLFHYKTKRQLLLALMNWLLTSTLVPPTPLWISGAGAPALEGFLDILRQEMNRLSGEPARIRLLFEFWVLGAHDAAIGKGMRRELARYREAFWSIGRAVLDAEPSRFGNVTVEGLSTLAVSFIKGCAVQAMIDPDGFDISQYLRAAESLIGHAVAGQSASA